MLREHIEIVAEYQDLAISGRKDEADRPGFEASMELTRSKAVEILYVAKLDRLSRRLGGRGSTDADGQTTNGWTRLGIPAELCGQLEGDQAAAGRTV
jgi:DNA invertase Pin-like site-specific DNA recombinase